MVIFVGMILWLWVQTFFFPVSACVLGDENGPDPISNGFLGFHPSLHIQMFLVVIFCKSLGGCRWPCGSASSGSLRW